MLREALYSPGAKGNANRGEKLMKSAHKQCQYSTCTPAPTPNTISHLHLWKRLRCLEKTSRKRCGFCRSVCFCVSVSASAAGADVEAKQQEERRREAAEASGLLHNQLPY